MLLFFLKFWFWCVCGIDNEVFDLDIVKFLWDLKFRKLFIFLDWIMVFFISNIYKLLMLVVS